MRSDRPYDLVLFGATGYIGRLVAEYLARKPTGLRWALAGRSRDKLEAVRRDLATVNPTLAELPLETADAHDVAATGALVARARVVCTTVGPYAKHGNTLVQACARSGTHYCDVTGEVPFIRRSIDENHAEAERTRARIVHCCGFDSVPFDLGVLMLVDHARRTRGEGLTSVKAFAGKMRGGFGGGGAATLIHLIEEAEKDRSLLRLMADPYALDPERGAPGKRGPDGRDQRGVRFDDDLACWTAPFPMAAVNTRVVRRSNALLGHTYGETFRYHEAMRFDAGPKGLATAGALTAALGLFVAVAAFPPTRRLLRDKVLPRPGEGPSREARERGSFEVHLLGETDTNGARLGGRVAGKGDPACGETAKMLAESALSLVEDEARLGDRFGVLTPASGMGMPLVERLRSAGIAFSVSDVSAATRS